MLNYHDSHYDIYFGKLIKVLASTKRWVKGISAYKILQLLTKCSHTFQPMMWLPGYRQPDRGNAELTAHSASGGRAPQSTSGWSAPYALSEGEDAAGCCGGCGWPATAGPHRFDPSPGKLNGGISHPARRSHYAFVIRATPRLKRPNNRRGCRRLQWDGACRYWL